MFVQVGCERILQKKKKKLEVRFVNETKHLDEEIWTSDLLVNQLFVRIYRLSRWYTPTVLFEYLFLCSIF